MITIKKLPCPNSIITLNGDDFLDVASGSTTDVILEYENGNLVQPTEIDGSVIVLPNPINRSTAQLMKTGQTTSYRTGDDGDIEAGRENNFLTLDSAPLHNNGSPTINTTTNRFTDTLGGQTYANDIVLDWSTWNGYTVLGVYRVFGLVVNWNTAIDNALALSVGTFTSGWRNANSNELNNFANRGLSNVLSYAPISSPNNHWTSSTYTPNNTLAWFMTAVGVLNASAKTSNLRYFPVRTFNLSTSNILS